MRRVLSWVDSVSEWSGKCVSLFIPIIIVVLLCEVTLRYVFNDPTIWAHETAQNLFACYAVISGAYVLLLGKHVKVDFIYLHFSQKGRAIIDSVTYLVFFLFVGVMLIYGVEIAWRSVKIMEFSHTPWGPPIWPLKLTLPIGAFLILLQGIAHWIRALIMAYRGKELT